MRLQANSFDSAKDLLRNFKFRWSFGLFAFCSGRQVGAGRWGQPHVGGGSHMFRARVIDFLQALLGVMLCDSGFVANARSRALAFTSPAHLRLMLKTSKGLIRTKFCN